MKSYDELLQHIESLSIIDTHEHLPAQRDLNPNVDVLSEWLAHYFSCDLVSAGLTPPELEVVRKPGGSLKQRWKLAEPYWHAARSTGYGRALDIAARDLFGVEEINRRTIETLNDRFLDARRSKTHYHWVLQQQSRIVVSIRDTQPDQETDPKDPFVYTMRTDPFVRPTHYSVMCDYARQVDVKVHTLADWEEVARLYVEKLFNDKTRVVCMKSGLAYERSLRYDKVPRAEAEKDFVEFFEDTNLPPRHPPFKPGMALQNHMQHVICRLADQRGITYQFHTGIQEGNGNVICDSNPTLLTNLFLEYGDIRFDVFHMGYPYVMELGNLAKNFRNVFIDMCWGHIISPEAARRALVEWLDAVPANKISAFGGDYCFVEGVYGHQVLARRNVAASLAVKVEDGTLGLERAKEIAQWVFVDNPTRIFNLDPLLKKGKGKREDTRKSKERQRR